MYLSVFGIVLRTCCLSASSLQIRTGFFLQVGYPVDSPTNSILKQTPFGIPPLKVYEIALSEVLATQMGVTGAQHKSQLRV